MSFVYKVVPAPKRGIKARGVKTGEDRFAHAFETAINGLAADGWDYLRTDTLPSEERSGLTRRTIVYQNMMVFRKAVVTDEPESTGARKPVIRTPVAPPVLTPRSSSNDTRTEPPLSQD